jgi:FkbM family methyltransferase
MSNIDIDVSGITGVAHNGSLINRRWGKDCLPRIIITLGVIAILMHGSGTVISNSKTYTTASLAVAVKPALPDVIPFDIPPTTKKIVINVGSNLDPIMPPESFGPCALAIAIEPIVGCQIPLHRQLSVIHAAVSDQPGVQSMRIYNANGLSSSLAKPSVGQSWNENKSRGDGTLRLVPVITLTSVIHAIPESVEIALIKTDMQGFDFTAIKEAGEALKKRVTHLKTEVWFDDVYTYDAKNDLCRDWMPLMAKLGYTLMSASRNNMNQQQTEAQCATQLKERPERPGVSESAGLREGDAFWVRNDVVESNPDFPDCKLMPKFKPEFTEEDYQTCES